MTHHAICFKAALPILTLAVSLNLSGCGVSFSYPFFQKGATVPQKALSESKALLYHPGLSAELSDFPLYFQTDPRWADYLCTGTSDPMSDYGCGPTAMAMVVTALTDETITPDEMAQWAWEHKQYSKGYGSLHSLIPKAAEAFGLKSEALSVRTPDAVLTCLSYDKILVLLMGPGHFTDQGHFIVVYAANPDGTVRVADPASPENSALSWDPSLLLQELSGATDSGSPVWVISRKD